MGELFKFRNDAREVVAARQNASADDQRLAAYQAMARTVCTARSADLKAFEFDTAEQLMLQETAGDGWLVERRRPEYSLLDGSEKVRRKEVAATIDCAGAEADERAG